MNPLTVSLLVSAFLVIMFVVVLVPLIDWIMTILSVLTEEQREQIYTKLEARAKNNPNRGFYSSGGR